MDKIPPQILDNPLDEGAYIIDPALVEGCHDIRFLYRVKSGDGNSPGEVELIMRYSKSGIHYGQGCRANDKILDSRLQLIPSNLEVTLSGLVFRWFKREDMPHPEGRVWQQTELLAKVSDVSAFERDITPYFEKTE